MAVEYNYNYNPEHTINLLDAQQRIINWQNERKNIKGDADSPILQINAFTFRFVEMFNLCASIYNFNNDVQQIPLLADTANEQLTYNALRFYLGIRDSVVPENEINDPKKVEACLICVPVSGLRYQHVTEANSNGNCYIANNSTPPLLCEITSGGYDNLELFSNSNEFENPNGIFDFSFPCPSTCDLSGQLLQSCA